MSSRAFVPPMCGRIPRSPRSRRRYRRGGSHVLNREGIMTKTQTTKTRVTRRALVAGAAAGTLAATTDMAAAQRCPETPPARTKGPLVWMDMDQHELDESY